MTNSPSPDTKDRLAAFRRSEVERGNRSSKQITSILLAAVPLGAILGIIALYIAIPISQEAESSRYVLMRPDLYRFLRIMPAGLLGGALTVLAVTYFIMLVRRKVRSIVNFLIIAVIYGLANPAVTAALLILNLLVLDIFTGDGVDADATLFSIAISPVFIITQWIAGLWIGLMSGAVLFVMLYPIGFITSSGHAARRMAWLLPLVTSLAVSLTLLGLILFGPYAIFEFVVEVFI